MSEKVDKTMLNWLSEEVYYCQKKIICLVIELLKMPCVRVGTLNAAQFQHLSFTRHDADEV